MQPVDLQTNKETNTTFEYWAFKINWRLPEFLSFTATYFLSAKQNIKYQLDIPVGIYLNTDCTHLDFKDHYYY